MKRGRKREAWLSPAFWIFLPAGSGCRVHGDKDAAAKEKNVTCSELGLAKLGG